MMCASGSRKGLAAFDRAAGTVLLWELTKGRGSSRLRAAGRLSAPRGRGLLILVGLL
jgi:hypothetical protein